VSKNVAVFVDVANIFYAAKAAGVDIDYVTLLKAASAGRDLVRAYAYTGLDPENENQRQFHAFLARNGYKVVSKDIRKYGDGKVKANLDIELVVDLMRTSRNLDIAVVVSGDGDFAPAIRAVQQTGIRVEVISFRGNTSSDLIEVADVFTDITQIARVERSSRSGRRVAAEEEDLSMTEVPDKETEGASRRRRGRHGEGRDDFRREERRGDRRERVYAAPQPVAAGGQPAAGGVPLVALPGEKLSKVAAVASGAAAPDEELTAAPAAEAAELPEGLVEEGAGEQGQEAGHRRRRRRGGRGRGRGRGQEAGVAEVGVAGEESEPEEDLEIEAPRVPQHSTFGSVWDSQLGMPTAPVGAPSDLDEEELEEPEIPEYLLSERRQRGAPRGGRPPMGARGGRGRGGAYQQAVERERYGRGAPAPARGPRGPERGPRPQFDRPDRNRPPREPQVEERQSSGSEPWSEVPPEVAELLRAEMARRGGARLEQPARASTPAGRPQETAAGDGQASPVSESGEAPAGAGPSRGTRGRGGRGRIPGATPPAIQAAAGEASGPVAAEPVAAGLGEPASTPAGGDARSRTRRTRTPAAAPVEISAMAEPPVAAPARRRGRAASATAPTVEATPASEAGGASGAAAAPSSARGRRSSAAGAATTPAPAALPAAEETAAPRRRARRTETASADAAPVAEEAKAPAPRRTRRAPAVPEA
jgi:uncharacterized LabA/DUF88 family protein